MQNNCTLDLPFSELQLDPDFTLEEINGGKNNRVYKVTSAKRKLCLKSYYFHKNEFRNRLDSEFLFLSYAWGQNIRCIPEPIQKLPEEHLGLYSFIDGAPINDVKETHIDQALNFIRMLNKNKERGKHLPKASEAFFTVEDHIMCLNTRIQNLSKIEVQSTIDQACMDFVTNTLYPKWERLQSELLRKNIPVLLHDQYCISPSDFGFHNGLENSKGEVSFIDFEYAGWDDPAKLVGDFFSQIAVPVPQKYFETFSMKVAELFPQPEALYQRIHELKDIFPFKWCCIILNSFLPRAIERREFSKSQEVKAEQLSKAKALIY